MRRAKGQQRVTYHDIIQAANLGNDTSQRTVEDALRAAGARYRPARKKVHLADRSLMPGDIVRFVAM